jgi:hypothetical protein
MPRRIDFISHTKEISMRFWRGKPAWSWVAVALLLALAPWARAQVLQQVPADAPIVIKFNNIKATSAKLGAMANKLGLAQLKPETADPLGAIKRQAKIQNGLDENGDAAFVITKLPDRGEPPLILLLPVTDYKAFIGNFADAKPEGEFTTFHFAGDGNLSYAANWGKYAAIGNRKEAVAQKPAGLKVAGLTGKELAERDIAVYVDMKVAREKMLPAIQQGRGEFLRDFERNYERGMGGGGQAARRRPGAGPGAAAPAAPAQPNNAAATKYMPVIRAMFGRFFDIAEQVVKDADAATYGLSLSDDGIRASGVAEFAPSSTCAQQVAKLKGTSDSITAGLPQTKYMAFGGVNAGSSGIDEMIASFVAPLEKEAAAMGSDGQPLVNYFNALKKSANAMKASSFGWVMPGGALGQEAIFQMVMVNSGDAPKMLALQKEMAQSQQAFMDMFSPPQMRGQMKMNFTENAKTVDGVALNLIKTQFAQPQPGQQQTPQMMQMRQMMTWMYGPQGLTVYSGAVGNEKLIAGIGVNDATLQALIASAKANQDPLAQQSTVQAVNAQLPKNHFFVAYVAIDNIATTVANYAKMFGMPINFQLPANLPPLAFSLSSEGNALRGDYYIPAKTVQSVVAGVMQTYMQMQGGPGGPGGPGGL